MPKVESRAVMSVEHDDEREELIVTFVGGARYAYAGVDELTYAALLNAESIGKFVNTVIKPRCEATRLNDRVPEGKARRADRLSGR